jgi:hypothetical protein
MAILLNQSLSNGISANYLRISRITIDRNSQKLMVDLALYLSKSARDVGNDPIQLVNVDLSSSYTSLMSNIASVNPIDSIYIAIMALNQFSGSVAC